MTVAAAAIAVVPVFDCYPDAKCGWLEKSASGAATYRGDERFRNGDQ